VRTELDLIRHRLNVVWKTGGRIFARYLEVIKEMQDSKEILPKDMKDDLSAEICFYDFCSEGLTFSDPDLVFGISATREKIFRLLQKGQSLEPKDAQKLQCVDPYVLSNIQGLPDDYDEDDPNQPFEKWWWHLKAIKEGRFLERLFLGLARWTS